MSQVAQIYNSDFVNKIKKICLECENCQTEFYVKPTMSIPGLVLCLSCISKQYYDCCNNSTNSPNPVPVNQKQMMNEESNKKRRYSFESTNDKHSANKIDNKQADTNDGYR